MARFDAAGCITKCPRSRHGRKNIRHRPFRLMVRATRFLQYALPLLGALQRDRYSHPINNIDCCVDRILVDTRVQHKPRRTLA